MKNRLLSGLLATLGSIIPINVMAEADPAEIAIGERLFLETRFAQAFYQNPAKAEPVLETTATTGKPLQGAFKGQTMSCRACHMVDEFADAPGMHTYADFAAMSPVPGRSDGQKLTGRNSMSLVNISKDDIDNILFHFDGEFNSLEDLVVGTFTGRNLGWLPGEHQQAIKHIASIVRNDDGKGELALEFGGSYSKILTSTAKDIPAEFRLPLEYRVDVSTASDMEIVNAVAKLVTAYVADLSFATDDEGNYNGSPYDVFLAKNKLPRKPAQGESAKDYGQRLLAAVNNAGSLSFVTDKDGKFETHKQAFKFGKQELNGMKLFFRAGSANQGGGNCASCHNAPHFTDFGFHNTGITQHAYDAVHGAGSFMKLPVPSLAERNSANIDDFRAHIAKDKPGQVDLGMWYVFANPAIPAPQDKLRAIASKGREISDDRLLGETIATFKTTSLRDTGHSAPYMHNGKAHTLEDVITLYVSNSALAKAGKLRNAATELNAINISTADGKDIIAFLRALNEDYD